MIELTSILIFIINDKFYIVEDNFVITEESHYVYQFIIRFLIYAMLSTRPNIVFVVSMISRYDSNFNDFH